MFKTMEPSKDIIWGRSKNTSALRGRRLVQSEHFTSKGGGVFKRRTFRWKKSGFSENNGVSAQTRGKCGHFADKGRGQFFVILCGRLSRNGPLTEIISKIKLAKSTHIIEQRPGVSYKRSFASNRRSSVGTCYLFVKVT